MEINQLIILIIAGIISFTGIIVNIFKKNHSQDVISSNDNYSLLIFRISIPLALICSLFLFFVMPNNLNNCLVLQIFAYFLILTGYCLRLFAIITLGKYFTVRISIIKNHELKTTGIFKKIRHPSYTGLLMYYLGLGIAMENIICLGILIIIPVFAVLYRINFEEIILKKHFSSQYQEYTKQSYKLFPFIY
jgi:protein-S-isoprenylcysteine O-methyltransferase Ste14